MANLEQNVSLTTTNLVTFRPLFSRAAPPGSTRTYTTTTSSPASARSRRRHYHQKHNRRDPYGSSASSFSSAGTTTTRSLSFSSSRKHTLLTSASIRSATSSNSSSRSRLVAVSGQDNDDDDDDYQRGIGVGMGMRVREWHVVGGREIGRSASKSSSRGGVVGGGAREAAGLGGGEEEEYDLGEGMVRGYMSGGSESDDGEEDDGDYRSDGMLDMEAWPRGIMKAVCIEVVEEVSVEYVAAAAAKDSINRGGVRMLADGNIAVEQSSKGTARNSVVVGPGVMSSRQPRVLVGDNAERVSGGSGIEQDWETMLRAGPPM
ncbi:hypothetical protein N658DRAFT_42818 [Parathielavia hyrcaniae]|uniref:Uncharacterized protein n=1 Tax=Parathielavia hyrcaniae TaxID=113614 RepID=A0AAN6T2K6_9PEZI|nr:hypothetical protein N658DRAFT_42818 [Parathielavia hyrcaniae]